MHPDYIAHHLRIWKSDMMKITPSEKGIGEIFFGIGGNNDHRPLLRPYCFIGFDDIKLHLVEHIEHIILKLCFGLVDLIDQQNTALDPR